MNLKKFKWVVLIISIVLLTISVFIGIQKLIWNIPYPPNAIENSEHWGGYSPYKIYTVFNKNTGVYYAVTETGDICPMYTIEGEVMLVDQGNEYVVHKNLGEPDAQE